MDSEWVVIWNALTALCIASVAMALWHFFGVEPKRQKKHSVKAWLCVGEICGAGAMAALVVGTGRGVFLIVGLMLFIDGTTDLAKLWKVRSRSRSDDTDA